MTNLILYSTGCPQCKALKSILDEAGIKYTICSDKSLMLAKGMRSVPMLEVNGELLPFKEAIAWIKKGEQ